MKKFIKCRNKILFITAIISIIFIILVLPSFVNSSYSERMATDIYIADKTTSGMEYINSLDNVSVMQLLTYQTSSNYTLILSFTILFVCVFNVLGYIYKKTDYYILSNILSIILICLVSHFEAIPFIIGMLVYIILNIFGCILQFKINK